MLWRFAERRLLQPGISIIQAMGDSNGPGRIVPLRAVIEMELCGILHSNLDGFWALDPDQTWYFHWIQFRAFLGSGPSLDPTQSWPGKIVLQLPDEVLGGRSVDSSCACFASARCNPSPLGRCIFTTPSPCLHIRTV